MSKECRCPIRIWNGYVIFLEVSVLLWCYSTLQKFSCQIPKKLSSLFNYISWRYKQVHLTLFMLSMWLSYIFCNLFPYVFIYGCGIFILQNTKTKPHLIDPMRKTVAFVYTINMSYYLHDFLAINASGTRMLAFKWIVLSSNYWACALMHTYLT